MAENESDRSDTSATAAASELSISREFRACWDGDRLLFRKS